MKRRTSRIQFDTNLTTSHVFLSPSEKRVRLHIYPPLGGNVTLIDSDNPSANNGMVLSPLSPELVLDLDDDGDIVQKAWSVVPGAGLTSFSWIEVMG